MGHKELEVKTSRGMGLNGRIFGDVWVVVFKGGFYGRFLGVIVGLGAIGRRVLHYLRNKS